MMAQGPQSKAPKRQEMRGCRLETGPASTLAKDAHPSLMCHSQGQSLGAQVYYRLNVISPSCPQS